MGLPKEAGLLVNLWKIKVGLNSLAKVDNGWTWGSWIMDEPNKIESNLWQLYTLIFHNTHL